MTAFKFDSGKQISKFRSLLGTASVFAISAASAVTAFAADNSSQNATAAPQTVEEVVVTGSRIVREGYEAPTPLTVVGTEQLEKTADGNIMSFLSSMPALSGSSLITSNSLCTACGTAGVQGVNLRSLGGNRALVLLDGQRVVGSDYAGTPDVASFPSQLISRVDVVTGGASAVYGSDAVAGVVNFILDRKFTGFKGELSGGLTNYGDGKNYKVNLTSGFGFGPDDRGHVLLSAEHGHDHGSVGDGGRDWNKQGWLRITNPTYTATNGQPNQLWLNHVGLAMSTAGGIVVSGPLKGTYFGPGGTPAKYNYSLYSNPYNQGGDWQIGDMRSDAQVIPRQTYDSVFSRFSYDITDNIAASVQYAWFQSHIGNDINHQWLLGNRTVKVDNAYLPASVRAAMVATAQTQLTIGSWNNDAGPFRADNLRNANRVAASLEGSFDAAGSNWHWALGYTYGATKLNLHTRGSQVTTLQNLAIDAVVNPANGQIVCRISLTDPNSVNGQTCKPWNIMGIGVNTGRPFFNRDSFEHALIEQTTYSASLTGEPFSLWAGPVSVAASLEHRKDEINSVVDQYSAAFDRPSGNFAPLVGKQSVTEGALEAIIPLAKGESWAQDWELSLASRFTGYELSGYVTTWKVGSTYTPIDDVKFRFTRSRDIHAPNLQELFAGTNAIGSCVVIDPVLGSTYSCLFNLQASNPNLKPEKADTTGIGVVVSPSFLEGFTASADYWDVSIDGAIRALNVQQVIDSCYSRGKTELCANIVRNAPAAGQTTGTIQTVKTFSVNLATEHMKGLDLEASYRMPVSRVMADWRGNFSVHGLMTFYFSDYQDNTFNKPVDRVGENTASYPPHWKLNVTAAYDLDPVSVSFTARAVSSGVYDKSYIVCTSGCPTSTADNLTINSNYVPAGFWMDANVTYKVDLGLSSSDLFFSVKNIFNRDPPPGNAPFYTWQSQSVSLYDVVGTVYRVGMRFKM